MKFVETVNTEQYELLFYNGRFVLYSAVTGKPVVSSSFTEKRIAAYLVELHEYEDEDDILDIENLVQEAKDRGVTGTWKTLKDCIETNTVGDSGSAMPYDRFIVEHFQRGKKGLYRCERCGEAVKLAPDVESFVGNGGLSPVSSYCDHCTDKDINIVFNYTNRV